MNEGGVDFSANERRESKTVDEGANNGWGGGNDEEWGKDRGRGRGTGRKKVKGRGRPSFLLVPMHPRIMCRQKPGRPTTPLEGGVALASFVFVGRGHGSVNVHFSKHAPYTMP